MEMHQTQSNRISVANEHDAFPLEKATNVLRLGAACQRSS